MNDHDSPSTRHHAAISGGATLLVKAIFLAILLGSHAALAQSVCLPAPRLLTTLPMGGKAGTSFDVKVTGQHLEQTSELRFSTPHITAEPKELADGAKSTNTFVVTVDADCPQGVHDARVMTRLGISSARAFSVSNLAELSQSKPNTTLEQAMTLTVGSICNGSVTAKSIDHYRFEARKGQRILVDCAAKGIDSKLNPVLIVADSDGADLVVQRRGGAIDFVAPADAPYTIKVHDLTFQGGSSHFYRLAITAPNADDPPYQMASTKAVGSTSWPPVGLSPNALVTEAEPNDGRLRKGKRDIQSITLPCDLSGSFFPAADVDTFEFEAKKGEVWWVEVASERLGRPTDPSALVQHVGSDGEGETLTDVAEFSDIPSPMKVSSNGYSYDGPPYNAGSSDFLGKLEIKADGRHRLQISDLFGGTRNDPRNAYRLIIRQASPDFSLVAWALHMNLRNGDRNALSKPIALRGGTTMPLEVAVIRRDGFDGEIELQMENLPDGVTAKASKIGAGKNRGVMLITADVGAPRGLSAATFTGRALIDGEQVSRPCPLASMAWPVANAWSEIPAPRLLAEIPVSVGGAEPAPLTIRPREEKRWEAAVGSKLTIPLVHLRQSEFSGATMSLKAFGEGFERLKPFDLPLTADSSDAVVDLAALKTPPGDYLIAFYGSAVAKHRHNVDAVAAAERKHAAARQTAEKAAAEAQRLAAKVPQASAESSEEAKRAAEAAAKKKAAADAAVVAAAKSVKLATNLAKPKDIVDIIVSEPIAIRVHPAESQPR